MSQDREDTSALINAYVDGELPPEAEAEVLARAARDPAFAQELAAITRLKATLQAAVPVPEIALPRAEKQWSVGRVALGFAACFLLLIVAGTGWFLATLRDDGALDARLDWATTLHRSWNAPESRASSTSVAIPASVLVTPHVPDLSANGLELVHAAESQTPGGKPALVLGYFGSRGCRVSIVVVKSATLMRERLALDRAGVRASLWQAGDLGYLLLAEGMGVERFRLISDSVYRATLSRTPFGPETRLALGRSRTESPPCTA